MSKILRYEVEVPDDFEIVDKFKAMLEYCNLKESGWAYYDGGKLTLIELPKTERERIERMTVKEFCVETFKMDIDEFLLELTHSEFEYFSCRKCGDACKKTATDCKKQLNKYLDGEVSK